MEKCDGDSEVGAVAFYESFLSQGLQILELTRVLLLIKEFVILRHIRMIYL